MPNDLNELVELERLESEQDKRGMAGEEPDAILTASEASVDAELRRLGVDPVAAGERGEAFASFAALEADARHTAETNEATSGNDTTFARDVLTLLTIIRAQDVAMRKVREQNAVLEEVADVALAAIVANASHKGDLSSALNDLRAALAALGEVGK